MISLADETAIADIDAAVPYVSATDSIDDGGAGAAGNDRCGWTGTFTSNANVTIDDTATTAGEVVAGVNISIADTDDVLLGDIDVSSRR